MTRPPFPLVRSGRRSCAGPGHQFGGETYFEPPIAGLVVVVVLVAMLVLGPVFVAVLSVVLAGQPDGPSVQLTVPVPLAPILESGRVLFTVALAIKVMRTKELD